MEITSKKVKKIRLDLESTLPYFIDHIKCGKTLSEKICDKIDFTKGYFFTILPFNADLERLYDFEHGGIILPEILEKRNPLRIEKYHIDKLITMDLECSELVEFFLKEAQENLAIVENYMMSSESPYAQIENVKMSCLNDEVYYFLDKKNSIKQIYNTIRKSSLVWHFLMVLFHSKPLFPDNLTVKCIDKICENTKFVIAGAYDGEGYIFWKRGDA